MQSAWEKLTGGQCNLNTPEVKHKPLTARQVKDNMRAQLNHVERKFDKLAALNGLIEQGGEYAKDGHKERRRMSESWMKRTSRNVEGFFKPQHAVPTA